MTQQSEPLTGVALARVVAKEVFGWQWFVLHSRREPENPFIYTRDDGTLHASPGAGQVGRIWEPWRDPRAWWEIVERMREEGWRFSFEDNILVGFPNQGNFVAGFVHRIDSHLRRYFKEAQTPGEAVMLAALTATRKEKNATSDT